MKRLTYLQAAEKGCFVYCYMRSNFAAGPYYVGIASDKTRPIHKNHNATPPSERERIRVMRSSLTWDQAIQWEKLYIKHYGRKDLGTGILRNLTDGGEGALGVVPSTETRKRMSAAQAGRKHTAETRAKMSAAQKGRVVSEESRQLMSEQRKGRPSSRKGKPSSPAAVAAMIRTQSMPSALKLQVDVDWYSALPKLEKIRARRASKARNIYGNELVEYMKTRHVGEFGGRPKKQ